MQSLIRHFVANLACVRRYSPHVLIFTHWQQKGSINRNARTCTINI